MTNSKLFLRVFFLAAAIAAGAIMNQYSAPGGYENTLVSSPSQVVASRRDCVRASLDGQPLVNGIDHELAIPSFVGSRRLSYADPGASQYIAKAQDYEVLDFYHDRMNALCWTVRDYSHNRVVYERGDDRLQLSLLTNPVSGKTVIDYQVITPTRVLGEAAVRAAQDAPPPPSTTPPPGDSYQPPPSTTPPPGDYTPPPTTPPPSGSGSCSGGQVWCPSSSGSGGWCQNSPCPAPPPPSSGMGSCFSGQVWCTQNGGGWCQIPPCPSSTPPTSTTCSGEYQQTGSTYPMCNYSKCPNGCNYGSDGCPNSCYSSMSSSCPSGQYWCNGACIANSSSCTSSSSSNSCTNGMTWCTSTSGSGGWCQYPPCPSSAPPSSSTTCTGSYQQPGVSYASCNYSTCPNGCDWGSNGCPSGCYTPCPSGQYRCNGSCISSNSYCAPSGGSGGMMDQSSCTNSGGLWCQPTTAPHCHPGPNPGSCEPDTPGGYTSCATGQYMCNGSCIASNAPCSPSSWPSDSTSCMSSGKYWCTPSTGGMSWCQSSPCTASTSSTGGACSGGQVRCTSSTGSGGWCQIPPCPSTATSSACPSGQYWCPQTNGCLSNSQPCAVTNTNTNTYQPTPAPTVKCGQCQVAQGGKCEKAPVGTLDPLCNGGQCDQYGGCVQLSGGRKLVGDGAICGDRWCNVEKGENKENCPAECTNEAKRSPQPVQYQPTKPQQMQPQGQFQPPSQSGQYQGQYPEGRYQQGPGTATGLEKMNGFDEEQEKQRQEQQFKMMKQNLKQFSKEITNMQKKVKQMESRLKKLGVGIPPELVTALAEAPAAVKALEKASTFEEVEEGIGAAEDIAMVLQEWGPKLGEIERFATMLKQIDKDVKSMASTVKRLQASAKRKPELQGPVAELEATWSAMQGSAVEAKALAKSDPESGQEKLDSFYDSTEEFWNQVSYIDMVSNVSKGLAKAKTELSRADRRVAALAKKKGIDPDAVAQAKAIVVNMKDLYNELKGLISAKPIDYEAVGASAEEFWDVMQEFENMMAAYGDRTYMPKVSTGKGVNVVIPEGFIMQNTYSSPAPQTP